MSRGFTGIWLLLILWLSLILCFYSFRQKKYERLLLSLMAAGVSYYFLQISAGDYEMKITTEMTVLVCVLCSLVNISLIWSNYRWQQTHLSAMSVKYAVDVLPIGICCYDGKGKVLLKNKTMEEIHWSLTGKALLNGITFENLLFPVENKAEFLADCRVLEAGETIVVIFPDHKVYEFSKEESGNQKSKAAKERRFVLTASDITEEYRKTQTLLEKQQTVTALNERLREYNKEILSVITAREVLNAKVKIHDELGTSLLRVKKYLENTGMEDTPEKKAKKEQEKQAILASLRQNVTFLQREQYPGESDEYELLLKTAEQLDVKIEIEGKLPGEEHARAICVTALHECLTNTLRHAKGNLLYVVLREDEETIQAIYTNNGIAPSDKIVEKGGLKSLRKLVEQENGRMEIQTIGGFQLSIIIGKRGTVYGI